MNMLATAPHGMSPSAEVSGSAVSADPRSGFRSVLSSQALLGLLRQYYPTGCLVSELVQVHADQLIVRSLVQVEGMTVATALASAATIEAAEDRARIRVLATLGISATAGYVSALPTPETTPQRSATLSAPAPAVPPVEASEPILQTPLEKLSGTAATRPMSAPPVPVVEAPIAPEPVIESPIADVIEPPVETPVEMSGGDDLEVEIEYEFTIEDEVDLPEEPPVALSEPPMDLSDAIAQIGAEIDRIGWTKKQGSTYLQQTYSKRTRAELTEAELFEFLKYLQSLPSKLQVPLSQIPF